jgi:hypothetical protein
MVLKAMSRPSIISSWPVRRESRPLRILSASAACMLPTMPTSGANTPMVAQRVSSTPLSSGNTQA